MIDGSYVLRWKTGPRSYVERIDRNADGTVARWRPYKPINRVDPSAVSALHKDGLTQAQIAERLGCNPATVSRALNRLSLVARRSNDYATGFDVAAAIARYKAGEGRIAIAASLGISERRLLAALSAAGVSVRGSGAVQGRPRKIRIRQLAFQTEFDRMRPLVRQRSGGQCEARFSGRCTGTATHVHHRKRRSQGGTNELPNLLDTCHSCHQTIHMRPADAYERGLLVRPWDDPIQIKVTVAA